MQHARSKKHGVYRHGWCMGAAKDRAGAEQMTQIVTYIQRIKIPLNQVEVVSRELCKVGLCIAVPAAGMVTFCTMSDINVPMRT